MLARRRHHRSRPVRELGAPPRQQLVGDVVVDGIAVENSAPAGDRIALGERWIGPFDPASFNDANGRVVVTYDTEADLTVGAFAL